LDVVVANTLVVAHQAFYTSADANDSVKYLDGAALDDMTLRVDLDPGYTLGREFEGGIGRVWRVWRVW
jgi:hypothetical protein